MGYILLDIGFLVFHTGWILFNLVGWIWEATRRWNLVTLLLTAFSWFGLGIFYGWGYCPCTHWHWLIRRQLGDTSMPNSYIKFLIAELSGINLPPSLVDTGTAVLFFLALILSLYVNFKDVRERPVAP